MKKSWYLLMFSALLAVPNAAQADSSSKDFANNQCTSTANIRDSSADPTPVNEGSLNLKLKWRKGNKNTQLDTSQILLSCQTGVQVAAEAARKICEACPASYRFIPDTPGVCGATF